MNHGYGLTKRGNMMKKKIALERIAAVCIGLALIFVIPAIFCLPLGINILSYPLIVYAAIATLIGAFIGRLVVNPMIRRKTEA
jgi:uncharacterized membrane protein